MKSFGWTKLTSVLGEVYRDRRCQFTAFILLLLLVSQVQQAIARPPMILPEDILWREVQRQAKARDLDPGFVYAIIFAESSFNAHAHNQQARGLMQMTPRAWEEVSDRPFYQAWNWRTNLSAGLDYLVFCRNLLETHQAFSYPRLAAAYRYGPFGLQKQQFNVAAMPQPTNLVYQQLFRGNLHPVPWPEG